MKSTATGLFTAHIEEVLKETLTYLYVGEIDICIHDGRIVQMNVTERFRFDRSSKAVEDDPYEDSRSGVEEKFSRIAMRMKGQRFADFKVLIQKGIITQFTNAEKVRFNKDGTEMRDSIS